MFEWDENKNRINIQKHGVSFDDAKKVFCDPCRLTLFDEGHSETEDRYYCIGVMGGNFMTKKIEYTDAPAEISESLNRAKIIPNFLPSPEQIEDLAAKRTKKQVSIYLSVETIDKFKAAAQAEGNRYQTMISNVLDTYTLHYL
jgi:uncharacterized DUF497 family protein